jgi:ATP-dependent helicase HrpA
LRTWRSSEAASLIGGEPTALRPKDDGRQAPNLVADIIDLLAARVCGLLGDTPRCAEQFDASTKAARLRLPEVVQEVAPTLDQIFQGLHQTMLLLSGVPERVRSDAAWADIRDQYMRLTDGPFLTNVPWAWLQHFPRYLRAIVVRGEKLLSGGAAKDMQARESLAPLWARYWDEVRPLPDYVRQTGVWLELRWLLEELRVSLFAQQLGTSCKVSVQRLEKLWQQSGSGRARV